MLKLPKVVTTIVLLLFRKLTHVNHFAISLWLSLVYQKMNKKQDRPKLISVNKQVSKMEILTFTR